MASYLPKVITTNNYNKYARNNITKTYKSTTANRVKDVNYKSKLLAEKLAIDDGIAKFEKNGKTLQPLLTGLKL